MKMCLQFKIPPLAFRFPFAYIVEMLIPDYQSLMLPLLTEVGDKQEHRVRDVVEALAKRFKLSEDDRMQLLPSGQQPLFDNRVGWAKTYLKKAGMLDSPRRATMVITQRGLDLLKTRPTKVIRKFSRGIRNSWNSEARNARTIQQPS